MITYRISTMSFTLTSDQKEPHLIRIIAKHDLSGGNPWLDKFSSIPQAAHAILKWCEEYTCTRCKQIHPKVYDFGPEYLCPACGEYACPRCSVEMTNENPNNGYPICVEPHCGGSRS